MNAALDFILEQIRGVWRFRWTAMLVTWIVCMVGWLVVLLLPDTYNAWTRVYVETRNRIDVVTQGIAVESNVAAQLDAVREALLGGPQLQRVALAAIPGYANAPAGKQAAIVDNLRTHLVVEANGAKDQPADLYVISYTDHDPQITKRVVQALLKLFIDNAVTGSLKSSEQAEQFLTSQISEYSDRLAAAESRLADFKRQNTGLVPGASGGDYFTRLQTEQDDLNKDRTALTVAEQKRDELRRQLAGETPLMGSVPGANGGALDTAGAIREAQGRLDELLLRFTDKHPDVIAARRTLEELKQRQTAEQAAIRRGDQNAIATSGLAANPVYQGIRLQLSQADVEVAAATRQVADREARIESLKKMMNTAPGVEAEYARLNRDYDVTRGQYQTLVERLNRAKLSDKADATGVVR
ncbi:MAG: hypothetical protein JO341_08045, partial [Gammaproteobacteria bacterium]|nr:hypothetical protein [Gammaproteobacteria bacterium]